MPPCKRCFAALVVAGVKKIVCRREPPKMITDCAKKESIQIDALSQEANQLQLKRINMLIHGDPNGKKRSRIDTDDDTTQGKKKNKED